MKKVSILGLLFGLALAASLSVAACGGGSPKAVKVTGTEFAFVAPATVKAGLVNFEFENKGKQDHEMAVFKLAPGKNISNLQQALQANDFGAFFQAITEASGVAALGPGGAGDATVVLTKGSYAMVCFVPDPADGAPHFVKGMASSFSVTGEAGSAKLPKADATVNLKDFTFEMPSSFSAGEQTLLVTNEGPQAHQLTLVKLNAGISFQDLAPLLSSPEPPAGPPPYTSTGGVSGLFPGGQEVIKVNLAAGNYVALCLVPDAATGKPHIALGMVRPFTAQ